MLSNLVRTTSLAEKTIRQHYDVSKLSDLKVSSAENQETE